MTDEYVEVPVTRRARVTLVNRLDLLGRPHDRQHGWPYLRQFGPGIDDRLAPDDVVVLRASEGAPFRAGFGRVDDRGWLDLSSIAAATLDDLLYRVESP